jgi:hypothetical protein
MVPNLACGRNPRRACGHCTTVASYDLRRAPFVRAVRGAVVRSPIVVARAPRPSRAVATRVGLARGVGGSSRTRRLGRRAPPRNAALWVHHLRRRSPSNAPVRREGLASGDRQYLRWSRHEPRSARLGLAPFLSNPCGSIIADSIHSLHAGQAGSIVITSLLFRDFRQLSILPVMGPLPEAPPCRARGETTLTHDTARASPRPIIAISRLGRRLY